VTQAQETRIRNFHRCAVWLVGCVVHPLLANCPFVSQAEFIFLGPPAICGPSSDRVVLNLTTEY